MIAGISSLSYVFRSTIEDEAEADTKPLDFFSRALDLDRRNHHEAAVMAATPDLLFGLRNSFYLGAYQAAINSSDIPNLPADDALERDVLVHRSYIALGSYQLVINEIDSSAPTALQAVKLLALYLSENKAAISSLQEWFSHAEISNNPILRLIAGTIYMYEQDYNEALKHTNSGGSMELHALNIQIFIKMHRSDYAEKQLKIMQQINEDHTLTQLANAWLDLAMGGSKVQEAYLIFQDFSEKYQMTGTILNGKAVCCMHMNRFDEAESLLLEALNKDAKDAETLANLAVCSLHLGKPSSRYLKFGIGRNNRHMPRLLDSSLICGTADQSMVYYDDHSRMSQLFP